MGAVDGLAKYGLFAGPLAIVLLALVTGCALAVWKSLRAAQHGSTGVNWTDEFSWPIAALLLTIVFIAATHPLIRGLATGIWDADGQFFPYFTLVGDHAKHGQFVTWDLWTNGGTPLMGDPQVGALSPVVLAFALLSGHPSQGFIAYWLFSWWLGGLGMLLLGRHLRAPVWGSFVVAVGFLFCGIYTGHAEHTSWIVGFSFVPWIIWRLDAALTAGGYLAAAQAGGLWGLAGLASHPSVVLLTACYSVLWILGRALFEQPHGEECVRGRPLIHHAVILAIFVIVGTVIFLPTYISFFFDGAGVHNRTTALNRSLALGDQFPPGALATFASPYLTIVNLKDRLWHGTDVSMVNVYIGIIIPMTAVLGLVLRPKSAWRWWIVGLAILSFCCAMGRTLPLRGWLYDLLLPMRFFRHSSVFRLFGVFSLAVLALVAIVDVDRMLADQPKSRRRSMLYVVGTLSLLAIAAIVPIVLARPIDGRILISIMHSAVFWGALVALAWFVYLSDSVARRSVAVALFIALAIGDALITAMLATPTIMALGSTRWHELDARHNDSLDQTAQGTFRKFRPCENIPADGQCKKNDQLITKAAVLDAYSSEKSPWRIATASDPILRNSAIGGNRFWFTQADTVAEASDANFNAFRQRADSLGRVPIVLNDAAVGTVGSSSDVSRTSRIDTAPPAVQLPARILKYGPRELVFDLTSPGTGWLLVTDRWSLRWRTRVNGREQPVYLANFIFRAVRLQPGPNTVSFHYAPWGFPWFIVMSWLILLAIAACTAAKRVRRLTTQFQLRTRSSVPCSVSA